MKAQILKHKSGFYLFIDGVDATEWYSFKEQQEILIPGKKLKTYIATLGTIPSLFVEGNPDFTIEEYEVDNGDFEKKYNECLIENHKWRINNPDKYFKIKNNGNN